MADPPADLESPKHRRRQPASQDAGTEARDVSGVPSVAADMGLARIRQRYPARL